MFEQSLVESRHLHASKSRGWIAAGSVGLQCAIAAVLVTAPLLHPEALSFHLPAPAVFVPLLKKPPMVVTPKTAVAVPQTAAAFSVPSVFAATRAAVLPSMRPVDPSVGSGVAVPSNLSGMGGPGGGTALFGDASVGRPPLAVVQAKRTEPLRVSAGVSSGMLLGAIHPVYPRIAVAARVEGVVVVEATISKTGAIESARVVSGPAMLAGAAIEAVRAARYRPYRLNGEATEVQTTVTVNFRLGS